MGIKINRNSTVVGVRNTAVGYAIKNLERDIRKKFYETQDEGAVICLENAAGMDAKEQFQIAIKNGALVISASDDLGFIYGIYEISKKILGITEFWFWNDQKIEQVNEITIPDNYCCDSVPYRVRYRGWFINDEVLIADWLVDKKKDKPWELQRALSTGADDYWIINCSNVKPHIYYLDFIADMWKTETIDIAEHRAQYVSAYYPGETERSKENIETCFKKYPECAVAYGKHEDEHAGEQFTNHVARILISQYMKDRTKASWDLMWTGIKESLPEQITWYQKLCETGKENYKQYLLSCEKTLCTMKEENKDLFRDSVMLPGQIHFYCYRGAYYVTKALKYALAGRYQEAFYYSGKARKEYLNADRAMHSREHGKWKGFYHNECLTDVKQSAWVLEGLMAYLRNLGDGPHYYKWQREYLYTEEERSVLLILNMENHLRDLELFELMEKERES